MRTMPHKNNFIPQIKRKRTQIGSGREYEYALINVNKRVHYLGPYGSDQAIEKYHRLVAEYLASGRSRTWGLPEHVTTLGELVADYLGFCTTYYGTGKTSELHRIEPVTRPLVKLYGSTPARDFGVLQFKVVRQQLIENGLSRKLINQHMGRIVRMFRWAASEAKLDASVYQTLATVPGLKFGRSAAHETDPIMPVDPTIVDATLPHLSGPVADMVRLQRLIGCRPAEVCMMRPCDVDRTGAVWMYRPQRHKTMHHGHGRVIPIGPQAQAVLQPYMDRAPKANCFSPREAFGWMLKHRRICCKAERKTPIYPSELKRRRNERKWTRARYQRKSSRSRVRQLGECYDPRSYRRAIAYACAKAGIESWAPNQLRHLRATEIRKQFGLEAAQVVLGHANAVVTQIYAERDEALAAKVALAAG
jgi:integrase